MAKSLLITGAAGFIGSEYLRQVVKDQDFERIFVVDKLSYAGDLSRIEKELEHPRVEFIKCDVNDTKKYFSVLSSVDSAVHFAAESHVDRSIENGVPFLESNVLGTYKLLEAIRNFPRIRTLLVSTDEVYGSIEIGDSDEDFRVNPSSTYSASKTSADLLALAMHHTFKQDLVITRGCNTYGPYQDLEKFIPSCISNIIKGKKAPLYGDGLNVREWMHVTDHAKGIAKVLEKGISGNIYNLGSGDRKTNTEVLEILLAELKSDWNSVEYVADRLGHDRRYALDSTRAFNVTGWTPTVEFSSGIKNTIEWYVERLGKK